MFSSLFSQKIISCLLVGILFFSFIPQSTLAGGAAGVQPVTDVGPGAAKRTIETTIGTAFGGLTANATTFLALKEGALDGIAYALTRKIIQSMVRSIVTWINSGFQGSPAFITDLKGFLLGIADEVVGDYIYGSDLAFLCSPFQLDIKIALATQYNEKRDGYQPQCTLTGVSDNIEGFLNGAFDQGGWQSWFELTQGSTNDPNKAYFEAELGLQAAIRDSKGNAVKELDWGQGFQSFKICSDTQKQSGAQKNCTITTPGTVIAEQLNKALGAGTDSLITADEINEVLGALLAQLAQQALTGAFGLLGMGGNSSYSDNSYGATGQQSFLEALEKENTAISSSSPFFGKNISDQIAREEEYLDIQYGIVARVSNAERSYASSTEQATAIADGCNLSPIPSQFAKWKSDGNLAIAKSNIMIPVLIELNGRLKNATNANTQNEIMTEYTKLEMNGSVTTETKLVEADLTLEYRVQVEIDNFLKKIADELNSCRTRARQSNR